MGVPLYLGHDIGLAAMVGMAASALGMLLDVSIAVVLKSRPN